MRGIILFRHQLYITGLTVGVSNAFDRGTQQPTKNKMLVLPPGAYRLITPYNAARVRAISRCYELCDALYSCDCEEAREGVRFCQDYATLPNSLSISSVIAQEPVRSPVTPGQPRSVSNAE